MTIAPFLSRLIALTGQTFMQAASSHCRHIIGMATAACSYSNTLTFAIFGLNSL